MIFLIKSKILLYHRGMRIVLITIILSIFLSGFIATANAAGHIEGFKGKGVLSLLDCCPEDSAADKADADSGSNNDQSSADLDCHHSCASQSLLPVHMSLGFYSLNASHELRLFTLADSGLLSAFFRPPQFSA